MEDPEGSSLHLAAEQSLEASVSKDMCEHPGFIRGLCMICGQKVDDDVAVPKYDSAVALKYIHKDLRLGNDEIARLRNKDFKNLLRHKKLYLVLDLDHTLLNSTRLLDITPDEEYLKCQTDSLQGRCAECPPRMTGSLRSPCILNKVLPSMRDRIFFWQQLISARWADCQSIPSITSLAVRSMTHKSQVKLLSSIFRVHDLHMESTRIGLPIGEVILRA
ncbi:protein-serine,threonine phosphatase [Sarracenia purpurea var. burkii]